MPGYHMYMVSNGIMDGKGYNPVPTLVPKYSSAPYMMQADGS